MLRAFALDFKKAWDEQLALIEFSYNNSYHSSIGKTPYEVLYGRRCQTPLCWQEVNKLLTIGPKFIQATTKKVRIIRGRMRVAQSRQKSYPNRRRRPLEIEVGDRVFLKVPSTKGITRFGMAGKLSQAPWALSRHTTS